MQKTLGRLIAGVYVIGALALGAYFVFFVLIHRIGVSSDPGDWGTLGDYFGGLLNPVISFATLVVAYAVWKQQREELKATKEALEEQAKTAEQQRQEQRFFDLLNTYYRVVDSLRFDHPFTAKSFFGKESIGVWLSAYDLFGEFLQPYGRYAASEDPTRTIEANKPLFEQLRLEWGGGSSEIPDRFGPYLRTVDKLLATANLVLTTHKLEYLHLFRAQLSNSELALIGYQVLLAQAGSELQKNVEQFGLLATLSHGDLRSALSDRLSASAFAYSVETSQEVTPC